MWPRVSSDLADPIEVRLELAIKLAQLDCSLVNFRRPLVPKPMPLGGGCEWKGQSVDSGGR